MITTLTDFRKNKTIGELKLKRLLNEYQTEYNKTEKKYYCTKNYQKEIERTLLTIKVILSCLEANQ